ncbi:MAG: fasciclin domain-containing protein [Bacteroidota bacterium]
MKKLLTPFMCGLFGLLLMVACSEDSSVEQPVVEQFEESEIISFDEIDLMTQNLIEGELVDDEDSEQINGRTSSFGISIERRFYDFDAEVIQGDNEGLSLEGQLRTKFTFYHALFTIIRGKFITPEGEEGRLRGAIVSDGIVYVIFQAPSLGTIYGIGREDENGELVGSFNLLGTNNFGKWEGNLTRTVIPDKTIVDILSEDGRFNTLVSAVKDVDLAETLTGAGPFTVLAPTDDAFAKLENLPSGETLKEILLYHVLDGNFRTARLLRREITETLQGEGVKVSLDENNNIVLNDEVQLLQANIKGTNGFIQIIDAVLIPPSFTQPDIVDIAVGADNLTTLVTALGQADLVGTLEEDGPFTVFAPTNEAFALLDALPEGETLKEVLLYHVADGAFDAQALIEKGTITTVQGEEVTIRQNTQGEVILNDHMKVSTANIEAANGIIHIIDAVLIPNSFLDPIVEIALATPELSELVSALQQTNLVGALEDDGPFTVFAPTNNAFSLLNSFPAGEALKDILLYHVVSGRFTADRLLELGSVTTLQGESVSIRLDESGDVILNDFIKVSTANIKARNGIIHIIDAVLLPLPQIGTIAEIAVSTPELSTLVEVLGQANLTEVLNGSEKYTVFAPTNAAFSALESTPQGAELVKVLTYHVVSGKFNINRLVRLGEVATLQGTEITVERLADRSILLNGHIKVVTRNVQASNGIIHIIDGVLIP